MLKLLFHLFLLASACSAQVTGGVAMAPGSNNPGTTLTSGPPATNTSGTPIGGGGGPICGPPAYACASTALNTIVFPAVPPQVGPNACSSLNLTACGNLAGAGTVVTDPDFGASIMRATDASTEAASLNRRFGVACSGSGDQNMMNINQDRVIYCDDGGRSFVSTFSWGTRFAPMYLGVGGLIRGFWTAGGELFFGHNQATPYRVYNLGNGVVGSASASGTRLGYYDVSNPAGSVPAFNQLFDFTSSANCLGASFQQTWSSGGESDQSDIDFSVGFSNNGGQAGPGAIYVAVWRSGSGCRLLNLGTWNISGDWGPTGAVTGAANCGGLIHNVKMYKSGGSTGALIITTNGGVGCPPGGFIWYYTGLSVQNEVGNPTTEGGGHFTEGLATYVNNTGNGVPFFWSARSNTNLNSPIGIIPRFPAAGYPGAMDIHCGWNVLNDTWPFLCTTLVQGGASAPAVAEAWQDEIIGIDPSGTRNPIRFAHTFNTSRNPDFNTQIAIGAADTKGQYVMFTSDWMGTLGSTSGAASCTLTSDCRGDVFVVKLF